MIPKRICFEDIQTSEILYYDPDLKDLCFRFCEDRKIDCLPSLDNPMMFYRKTEAGFCEDEVTPERMVDGRAYIFDQSLLERFCANHLLFVYSNDELTGVVHFSDYNRQAVSEYLFSLLSSYEKSLRNLLVLNKLGNEDMLGYFREMDGKGRRGYKNKIDDYEEKRAQNELLPAFEMFYMLNLIELVNLKSIMVLSKDVSRLRNMVMHAHEFVNMYDANRDDYIYDYDTFKDFFNRVAVLLQDYKKVNNRITLLDNGRVSSEGAL
jgi:hypothetical protein